MPTWFLPVGVEVLITLLFCGVLFYLRSALSTRGMAFWIALWVLRGAGSLLAYRYLEIRENAALVFYAPLQIAFAMALVVIAVRLENQRDQLRHLNEELARLRHYAAGQLDQDPLTGLRNRTALSRWVDEDEGFDGLVVVCDMDDFKVLNDLYGHLVGDEILRGVGHLVRNSVRDEDLAFRWGGDEFVIFFHTPDRALVESRMREIEERLRGFYIRQQGPTEVRLSWGITTTTNRPLRESLAQADRLMYEAKRARHVEPPSGRATAGSEV